MDGDTRYSIGDLARRTGLSVRTIRFSSDRGVLAPTSRSPAGYRRYDLDALARPGRRRGHRPLRPAGAAGTAAGLPLLRPRHPNRYAAMHQAPPSDPQTAAVGERLMGIVLAMLGGFGLEGPAAIHAAGACGPRSVAVGVTRG
jgi:hypothetical protein